MYHEAEGGWGHHGHGWGPWAGQGHGGWPEHHGHGGEGRMGHAGVGHCCHHGGEAHHGTALGPGFGHRRFFSKAEVITSLEEYLKQLKAEATGVEERIAELKKGT